MTITYHLHDAALNRSRRDMSFLLSSPGVASAPGGHASQYASLLQQLAPGPVLDYWSASAFFTMYFERISPPEPSGQFRQVKAWEVHLLTSAPIGSGRAIVGLEQSVELEPTSPGERHEWLPMRVIANFPSQAKAKQCLQACNLHAKGGGTGWKREGELPRTVYDRTLVRRLLSGSWQLWVDLAYIKAEDVSHMLPHAAEVEALCESMGGHTRKDTSGK